MLTVWSAVENFISAYTKLPAMKTQRTVTPAILALIGIWITFRALLIKLLLYAAPIENPARAQNMNLFGLEIGQKRDIQKF